MPPKQVESLKLRDEPGWVTFSHRRRYAYPSTGDVIDVETRKIVADAEGRGRAVRCRARRCSRSTSRAASPSAPANQFGVGRVTSAAD